MDGSNARYTYLLQRPHNRCQQPRHKHQQRGLHPGNPALRTAQQLPQTPCTHTQRQAGQMGVCHAAQQTPHQQRNIARLHRNAHHGRQLAHDNTQCQGIGKPAQNRARNKSHQKVRPKNHRQHEQNTGENYQRIASGCTISRHHRGKNGCR